MCTEKQAYSILQEVYRNCNDALDGKLCDAYLYGSYARGDYDAESDVDVLLTAEMNREELALCRSTIAKITSRISMEHDVTVSVTVKPNAHFRQYASVSPYYSNVLKEGVRYAE